MDTAKKTISDKAQSYIHVIQKLSMLLYNTRLYYGIANPMVKAELSEVLSEIEKTTSKENSLIFSVLGDTLLLNGEKLEIRDGLSKQFINNLAKLSLGALDLKPGLPLNELETLIKNNGKKRPKSRLSKLSPPCR